MRYNSLPCGTECFTGCREAQTTNAREKQACSWFGLIGCRDVITSCVSASFSLVAAILDALLSFQSCFLLYLWIYCLSFVHNSAFPLFSSIESYTQFSALPVLYFVSFLTSSYFACCVLATTLVLLESTVRSIFIFYCIKTWPPPTSLLKINPDPANAIISVSHSTVMAIALPAEMQGRAMICVLQKLVLVKSVRLSQTNSPLKLLIEDDTRKNIPLLRHRTKIGTRYWAILLNRFLDRKPNLKLRPIICLLHLHVKQAQHFSTRRKVQNGNARVHQDFSDSGGMGSVNRPVGRLPPHPHPSKLKEVSKILPQVTGVPVHLAPIRTSHSPPGIHHGRQRSEAHGPQQRTQTSSIPGRLADQVSVPGGSISEHSDSGRSHPVLGMDLKPREIRTETNSGVLVRGLRIPPRFSPCKTHSREMAQTSGFDPTTQVETCFDCKMFDVSNWVASLNGEDGPGGTPSHETVSVSPERALEISSVAGQPPSLDRSHFCSSGLVAESCKGDDRRRPSSQRPQYPTLYRRLKRRLGRSLRTKFYKRAVVTSGKRTSHKRPRIESCLSGFETLQRPVSGPNSASCHGQLNCGSLHKQTRGNTLGGDVRTPVETHDLVPPLSHNLESQTHSRVPECDGRPTFQVEPGSVDRMVTPIQLPLYVSPIPDPQAWDIDALNIDWTGLTAYAYPPTALLYRVIQKIRQCTCLIILIAPGWPGMPWFWDLVQLSTEIPLQLPVSTTLLKQSHNFVFHSSPQHLNLHAWSLGVDNSKNKASLWKWQRELLHLSGLQQGTSTNQSGPYLKNGAEIIRWISPHHL